MTAAYRSAICVRVVLMMRASLAGSMHGEARGPTQPPAKKPDRRLQLSRGTGHHSASNGFLEANRIPTLSRLRRAVLLATGRAFGPERASLSSVVLQTLGASKMSIGDARVSGFMNRGALESPVLGQTTNRANRSACTRPFGSGPTGRHGGAHALEPGHAVPAPIS
jgi:hypothetical protein